MGRENGALTRSSANLNAIMGASTETLEQWNMVAGRQGVQAGQELNRQLNLLNNTWSVFKQNLAGTAAGSALTGYFALLNKDLRETKSNLDLLILAWRNLSGVGILGQITRIAQGKGQKEEFQKGLLRPGEIPSPTWVPDDFRKNLIRPSGGGGGRGGGGLPIATFDALTVLGRDLKRLEENAEGAANGLAAMKKREDEISKGRLGNELERLSDRAAELFKTTPLALGPTPEFRAAAAEPIGPAAKTIRTEAQAALDEQFNAIFDDMLISIITARQTLGGAFAGLALGIVDQFAIEFTKAFRESFITPVIQGLTELLNDALGSLFGGLKGGSGLKGVFGGIFKGLGTIFGGLFASGGTLGPGKFGIAGERGPELIFAGNQPMHIAPVTAGSAGNVFNISIPVNAPAGTVDRYTQDQIAVTVMNAVKRAQRNEGAR